MKQILEDELSTLESKIEKSSKVIEAALNRFPGNQLCLAWTGGKDSTLMLWLYYKVCNENGMPIPRAMFIDEGHVFEEIFRIVEQVRKKWKIDVTFVKNTDVSDKAKQVGDLISVADLNEANKSEIKKIGFAEEHFAFEPESFIGNHLMKTAAMNSFLVENNVAAMSTAIRWDEQTARVKEEFFSPRENPPHTRVHPILHFTERDVWDTIHRFEIPFCSLYFKGYRSLGAKGSTKKMSDIPAWEQDLENTPERIGRGQEKESVMEQLRNLGYM